MRSEPGFPEPLGSRVMFPVALSLGGYAEQQEQTRKGKQERGRREARDSGSSKVKAAAKEALHSKRKLYRRFLIFKDQRPTAKGVR